MREVRVLSLPANTDHIKPCAVIFEMMARKVVQCGFGDVPLFAQSDCRKRITKCPATMRAHFDKHNRLLVPRNQINLTKRRAVISCHNRIALGMQELLGSAFPSLAEFSPPLVHLHRCRVTESTAMD